MNIFKCSPRLVWVLTIFLSLNCVEKISFAQAIPTDTYTESITKLWLQERASKSENIAAEVKNKMDEWTKGELPIWRLGNPNPESLFDYDADVIEEYSTKACNLSDGAYSNGHSYEDLEQEPETEFTYENGECVLHYKYPPAYDGNARRSGLCDLRLSLPPYCPTFIIRADLVEYLFPTAKINISEQLFHSRYLSFSEVSSALVSTYNTLSTSGMQIDAPRTLGKVMNKFGLNSTTLTTPNFQLDQLYWIQAPAGTRAYSRIFGEDFAAESFSFRPHIAKKIPSYATDIDGFRISTWLPESSLVSSSQANKHMSQPEVCIRNNMYSGKTPDFPQKIDRNWSPAPAFQNPRSLDEWLCIKDIGEVIPFTASRRINNSDGFVQALVKGLKIYQNQVSKSRRYDFRPDVDMIHFLPSYLNPPQLNSKYQEELGQEKACHFIDDLSKANLHWDDVNIREAGSGQEGTIEIFTRFRGCWGFPGAASYAFTIRPETPTRFDPLEIRVE